MGDNDALLTCIFAPQIVVYTRSVNLSQHARFPQAAVDRPQCQPMPSVLWCTPGRRGLSLGPRRRRKPGASAHAARAGAARPPRQRSRPPLVVRRFPRPSYTPQTEPAQRLQCISRRGPANLRNSHGRGGALRAVNQQFGPAAFDSSVRDLLSK